MRDNYVRLYLIMKVHLVIYCELEEKGNRSYIIGMTVTEGECTGWDDRYRRGGGVWGGMTVTERGVYGVG